MKKWDLPKGWVYKKLGEISKIRSGGTPSRSCPEYWNKGTIPWVKIGDMSSRYVEKTQEKISQYGLDNSSAKLLEKDTLLISIFATLGEVSILKIDAACNQAIAGITVDPNLISTNYLYYYLIHIKNNIKDRGRGVAQNNINMSILNNTQILVPPIETQQKIVAILDKAEEIKRLRAEANAQTQKLIQSVFLDMFGDPVKNMKGWTVKPLGKIAKLVNGKAFKPDDWKSSGLPIIRIQNLNDLDSTYNYYDGLVDKRYLVRYGDLLFAWSGTPGTSFGAHIWAGGEAVLNQHIYNVIVDNKSLNKKYLEYAINGVIDSIIKQSHGSSGLAHITKKELEKVGISCPPIALQNEFESIYQKITETIIDNSLLNSRESNSLYETVLRKTFTGELVT